MTGERYKLSAMAREKKGRFGEVLSRAYKGSKFSNQSELGDAVGSGQSYISQLMSGFRAPSPEMARALAEALGADVDEFLLAAGFAPESLEVGRRPVLQVLAGLGPLEYPPTEDEERVMVMAERRGVQVQDFRSKSFWEKPPEKRRRTFMHLELLVEEFAEIGEGEEEVG